MCGAPNAVIFRLKEKQELVGRIGRVLNLTIDLEVKIILTTISIDSLEFSII